jgi:N-acetylglucosamine kinase-like BadF-type ATPase
MSRRLVLAVDGGNSKTDLALLDTDGRLRAFERGPLSSPHHVGLEGAVEVVERLLADAVAGAGLSGRRPVADVAQLMMAGADLPAEEAELEAAVSARRWAARTTVRNDTFALLRAGSDRGWGVAVVCGAGINCVGVAPDGHHVRFPALGAITGDWGGGYDVGLAALGAAARSEDGRAPASTLERLVPRHFGLQTPAEVGEAIHLGQISLRRMPELAPLVLGEAVHDPAAQAIVDQLAREVVAFAAAALNRLGLAGQPVEVILGGGLMRAASPRLRNTIDAGLRAAGPGVVANVVTDAPIVGAALLGLDEIGALPTAGDRLRRELRAAIEGSSISATIGGTRDG